MNPQVSRTDTLSAYNRSNTRNRMRTSTTKTSAPIACCMDRPGRPPRRGVLLRPDRRRPKKFSMTLLLLHRRVPSSWVNSSERVKGPRSPAEARTPARSLCYAQGSSREKALFGPLELLIRQRASANATPPLKLSPQIATRLASTPSRLLPYETASR